MTPDDLLPPGWCWTTVGELVTEKLCNGVSVKGSDTPPGVPALKLSSMREAGLDYSVKRYIPIGTDTANALAVQLGDFFVSRANGSLHLVGRGALAQQPPKQIVFPDTMIRLRLIGGDELRKCVAVLWQTDGVRRQVEAAARTTAGIYKISQQDIERFRVPLPPLAEQRRIVAKVEELFADLDEGTAALRRVQAKLKRYRSAVLRAAVDGSLTADWRAAHPAAEPASVLLDRIRADRRRRWEDAQRAKFAAAGKEPKGWQAKYADPAGPDPAGLPTLPEGWCWASMDELITSLRNGLSPKPKPEPPGCRILRINAVRPLSVDLDEVRYLEVGPEGAEYLIGDGDLLFTRYNGSLELLGVAGMVRGLTTPTLHPDKLIRVQTVLGSPLPEFLELAANAGVSRQHMKQRARTTAGQTGISGADVREMPIPLPPPAEQAAIVAEVERRLTVADAVAAQVDANLRRAGRLRQGVLKRAFVGELVPQNPADEPAAALLERLRSQRLTVTAVRRRRPSQTTGDTSE